MGDIVYVELPQQNKQVEAKREVAVLESTKAAADIYSPVSGVIVEVNVKLAQNPELINESPEKEGWIYKIRLSDTSEIERLMDKADYEALLNGG